jgi:acetoin:2,6-dichlorophenolindophenol oxidoreductase subunit alpha
MGKHARLYREMLRIRRFESLLMEQFSSGVFPGTTHTSLGQEANAVGVLSHLGEDDIVISNHRCHGHFLAYGGDPQALFAELMGKPGGVCKGIGGSQHLHWRNFYSNGVQGGTVAMAAGMAMAEKRLQSGSIVVDFMGDGTLGEGIVYECLNMIALWQLPILIVLEHNHIAQTTPSSLTISGSIQNRFEAFGIPAAQMDSSDILDILPTAGDLMAQVKQTSSPHALIIETARLGPHSKGDDTRSAEIMAQLWQTRDPITIHAARLTEDARKAIDQKVDAEIQAAFETALASEDYSHD